MPERENISVQIKRMEEGRKLIGKGILEGILKPGRFGPEIVGYYNQTDGGYWQNDGDGHTQGSGDYHQGTA